MEVYPDINLYSRNFSLLPLYTPNPTRDYVRLTVGIFFSFNPVVVALVAQVEYTVERIRYSTGLQTSV